MFSCFPFLFFFQKPILPPTKDPEFPLSFPSPPLPLSPLSPPFLSPLPLPRQLLAIHQRQVVGFQ